MRIKTRSLSWQQVDDEVVVLDLDQSKYLSLNGSAAVLWNGLAATPDEGMTADDLTTLLTGTYGISAEQANADAHTFVERGLALGLLE